MRSSCCSAGPSRTCSGSDSLRAVVGLIEQFGVRMTVGVHGIPMAVPHTRPITLTAHATDASLVRSYRSWIDRVEVPASFTGLLEFRLGQLERTAMGFAAHVPHYLAQASFPEATLTLTRSSTKRRAWRCRWNRWRRRLPAISRTSLRRWQPRPRSRSSWRHWSSNTMRSRLRRPDRVPSAEEIAAEFERFLAEAREGRLICCCPMHQTVRRLSLGFG